MSGPRLRYEDMTPEGRAAVDAVRARNRTPEARAETAAARVAIMREVPPANPDIATLAMLASLRAERERQGLSLTDMAERSGVERSMVAKLETGKLPNPTIGTLRRLARALGMELSIGLVKAGG